MINFPLKEQWSRQLFFVDKIWKGLGFYPVYKLNNYPIIVLYGLAENIGVFDGRQRTYYSKRSSQKFTLICVGSHAPLTHAFVQLFSRAKSLQPHELYNLLCSSVHRIFQARIMELVSSSYSRGGEGNGNPLQYTFLGNPMDRGAWQATVLWGH